MRYFLELCVQSVQNSIKVLDAEIIVVDNNSPDDSCAMMKEKFPEITLLENKDNVGFSKANNQGVALAKGEYICILNPDTVVAEDTFVQILEEAKELPDMGMLGARMIDGTGSFLPESKRNIPSPMTSFSKLFGIKFGKVKSYYADHLGVLDVGKVDVLVGAFLVVKKDDYLAVGGLDEDYFMYGEDIDLSYKITKNGLQNYYIGNIPVIHYKGESTDRNKVYQQRFYGAMRMFYKKHFKSNWFFDVFVSVGITLTPIVKSLKKKDINKRKIQHYYLISDSQELKKQLQLKLNSTIELTTIELLQDLGDKNIEIIFDNNLISYKQIICQMLNLQSENVTFKIKPKNCNYILGSNLSDGKGEVIQF